MNGTRSLRLLFSSTSLVALISSLGLCATIHMSPGGPVSSLEAARDAVRALKAARPGEPVRVVVAGGEYALPRQVLFTPRDGGTAEAPVTYVAAPGAKPVFSAGRRITGFRVGADGTWSVRLPDVAAGTWYFEQLYVDNAWATRCRTPNAGYHYMLKKVGHATNPFTGAVENLERKAFIARTKDVEPFLSTPKQHLTDVTLVSYHSWAVGVHRVGDVDARTGRIVVTGGACWPFMRWKPQQRYHLENFRAALDAPGEWFLDRDGTLSYKPLPGQTPGNTTVYAPVGSGFLRIAGEPALGMTVSHITFEGLAFRHAGYILPERGHADGQAAVNLHAAVECDAARDITLRGCELGCIGPYAVWFHDSCRRCRLEKTFIHDMGGGGVKIGHAHDNRNPGRNELTSHCAVDNCIINRGTRLFRGAIGVWVGNSPDNEITHNDISDFFYSTVSLGWVWGYSNSVAKRNTVRFNRLHHYGQYVMSDLGAVYTLGRSEGTVISDNVMHDGYAYDYGGWGMYTDEGSSDIVWERNLVYNVKTGGFHQHYGKDNILRNNILAFSHNGQIQRSRVEPHRSFIFTNNIVYWDGGPLLTSSWNDDNFDIDSNLYWEASGAPVTFAGMPLDEWRKRGNDKKSIVADPLFVDAQKRDFRLKPGSPASKIGFEAFDYSKAGVSGDDEWGALARGLKMPEFAPPGPPPPPPPKTFAHSLEELPAGTPPQEASVHTEGKGDRVAVVEGQSAGGGGRALLVADVPGLQHNFNPHFYYSPAHTAGTTTFAFDIRIVENTQMYHEWRSAGNPYRVGPSLSIQNETLRAVGRDLMALPAGAWTRIEITAGIGPDRTGTWDLVVTVTGSAPRRFEKLTPGHADWKRLDWLGFSSTATWKTEFHLDNLELSHKE